MTRLRARKKREADGGREPATAVESKTKPLEIEAQEHEQPKPKTEPMPTAHWDFEKRGATLMVDGDAHFSDKVFPLDAKASGSSKVGAEFQIGGAMIRAKVSLVWWDVVKKTEPSPSAAAAPRVFRAWGPKAKTQAKSALMYLLGGHRYTIKHSNISPSGFANPRFNKI